MRACFGERPDTVSALCNDDEVWIEVEIDDRRPITLSLTRARSLAMLLETAADKAGTWS